MSATASRVSLWTVSITVADLLGGLHRPLGQPPHLVRHDREALARVARAGRFDRGVERQQVGLVGDPLDDLDDLADLLRAVADRVDRILQPLAAAGGCRPPTAGSPRRPCAPGWRSRRRCRSSCSSVPRGLLHRAEERSRRSGRSAPGWRSSAGSRPRSRPRWPPAPRRSWRAAASGRRSRPWWRRSPRSSWTGSRRPRAIWVGGGGDLLGRRSRPRGRRWRSGWRSPQVLDHLPHRVLQPADLVPRLAPDVGGQVALGDLLGRGCRAG